MPSQEPLRYVDGENSLLRSILWELWGYKCYFCHASKAFSDVQIDHIVPRSAAPRLQELAAQFNLPSDFAIDGPENLAPICGRCNRDKGSNPNLLQYPNMILWFERARRLAPDVERRARDSIRSRRAVKAIVQILETDLGDPATREAFESLAPAVIQKLALVDEGKADLARSFSRQVGLGTH